MIGYACNLKLKTFVLISITFCLFCTVLVLYIPISQNNIYDNNDEVPVLLWWTPFVPNDRFIRCPKSKCLVTPNRHFANSPNLKAFLFYGSSFKPYDLPLLDRTKIPWAIFHEESPKNLAFFLYREGQKLFNVTATFSRYSNFPLTFQYLKTIESILDTKYYVPLKKKNTLLKELSPVLYIHSDCETPTDRDKYVKELMQYIKIDSYGKCLNNKQLPARLQNNYLQNLYDDELMHFIARYKFIISIENSVCDDYITEKLWRPLIAGVVPIYFGSPSVQDWLPNSNSAILIKDFSNVQQLAKYIHQINKNDTSYQLFLQHKLAKNKITNKNLTNTFAYTKLKHDYEHLIPAFQCYICDTIFDNQGFAKQNNDSVYNCPIKQALGSDVSSWESHWKMGACEIKTFKYFTEKLRISSFSEEMFANQTMKYFFGDDCSF